MKRHLLTVALAIVALGGAVASTANNPNAPTQPSKDITDPPGECVRLVDCQPGLAADCFFNEVLQIGEDNEGTCSIPLEQIPL